MRTSLTVTGTIEEEGFQKNVACAFQEEAPWSRNEIKSKYYPMAEDRAGHHHAVHSTPT
jgi:hypothetical protein